MGFFRQEYWSGSPFPPPGDLPSPRIKPASPVSAALAGGFFFLNHWATLETLSIKELKTKVLQCFFKYLFQLHKISTFSLARSTSSFFCWSIFSSAAFLVLLPQSFLCCCLSVVCQHSPPSSSTSLLPLPILSLKKKTTLFIDCLACFLPILHSPGRLGQSGWKYPDSMGKSPCHQGWTGLV